MKSSLLMEVIHEIKDKRPLIKDILCEAILLEMEKNMEMAYEEGIKEGRKQTLNKIVENRNRTFSDT